MYAIKRMNPFAYAFLALTVCFCLCCRSSPENPDDLYRFGPWPDYATHDRWACWSGTHDLIAYVHDQYKDDDPDSSDIYLINPDASDKSLFHRQDVEVMELIKGLDWSPDGEWLVFSTWGGLFKISYPGGTLDTLMGPGEYYWPAWSPDGTKIACVKRGGDQAGIYTIKNNGTDYRLIIPDADYPAWLYSDSILYTNYAWDLPIGSFCLADSSGLYKRLFMDNSIYYDGEYGTPRLRRTKAHLGTGRITCVPSIPESRISIWIFEPDWPRMRQFFQGAWYPNFSPDGNQLVFTDFGTNFGNLWIINWDGTGLRQLTEPLIF